MASSIREKTSAFEFSQTRRVGKNNGHGLMAATNLYEKNEANWR